MAISLEIEVYQAETFEARLYYHIFVTFHEAIIFIKKLSPETGSWHENPFHSNQ